MLHLGRSTRQVSSVLFVRKWIYTRTTHNHGLFGDALAAQSTGQAWCAGTRFALREGAAHLGRVVAE
jgi:hypothetical protein